MYVNVKSSIAFKMLCFRSLLSAISIMILLYNVSKIPLSFANSLHNLAPVIICFIEAVYNKVFILIILDRHKQKSFYPNNNIICGGIADFETNTNLWWLVDNSC